MTRPRSGIGSELLVVILVPVCLAGSLALIVATHRRAAVKRPTLRQVPVAVPVARVEPAKPPPPPPTPVKPPEDPTKGILARLALAEAEQKAEARRADRKAEALEAARRDAIAQSRRWKRREMAVRSQIDALSDRADEMEKAANALALQRDALAVERDASKAALAKARTTQSYAIRPHKGPNGTWRRPIVIECRDGTATLQPRGPSVSLLELSPLFGGRSNPLVAAVARELVRSQAKSSPDGAPIVPYIYFVVRPDGIRPYYEARSRLEPLGIAFGYELVEQDWEIEYPDSDDPGPASGSRVADVEAIWPADRPGQGGSGSNDSFLWPTEPRGSGEGSDPEDAIGRPGGLAGERMGVIPVDELRRRIAALERAGNDPNVPRSLGELPTEPGGLAPGGRPLGIPSTARPIEVPNSGNGDDWARGEKLPQLPDGGTVAGGLDRGRAAIAPGRGMANPPRAVGGGGGGGLHRLGTDGIEPGGSASEGAARPQGGMPGSRSSGQGGEVGTGGRAGAGSMALEAVDVPFEIVVACGPNGVVIHPGGYPLSLKAMKEQKGLFAQYLETTAHLRRQVEPTIRVRPRVRFLVEAGGSTTYWEARRQTMFRGLDWPVSIEAADSGIPDVFPKESW